MNMKLVDANIETVDLSGNMSYTLQRYRAGENIKIEDFTISVDGIEVPTKLSELENDKGYLTEHLSLDGKQDKLSAKQLANINADHSKYLTEHQSLDEYAKKTDIPEPVDLTDYAKKTDIPEPVDLTDYAKKTDIPTDYLKEIPEEYVKKNDLSIYYTGSEIEDLINESLKDVSVDGVLTKDEADSLYQPVGNYLTEIPAEYITEDELAAKNYLTEHQDLSDYALKSEIPTDYLTEIPAEYVTETLLESKNYLTEHLSLANYATKNDIKDFIKTIPSEYITETELTGTLSDYALDSELQTVEAIAKGKNMAHVFDTKDEMDSTLDDSEFTKDLTIGDNLYIKDINVPDYWWDGSQACELETLKVDLAEYAKKSEIPTDYLTEIPAEYVTETLLESKNYLTEHQDLSAYALKSEIPAPVNLTNYLDKTYTGTNVINGKFQVGDHTTNTTNAYLHIRKVTASITGNDVNGACFAVNGDGTASFQHKTYNNDGTGAKNSAILRFSNQGILFAINSGTSASPAETDYKELATLEYVDSALGDIKTILESI